MTDLQVARVTYCGGVVSAETYREKCPDVVRQWRQTVRRFGADLLLGLEG
jgi:hypothetical protein